MIAPLLFAFVLIIAAAAGITGIGAHDSRDASWGMTPRGANQDGRPVRFGP